MKMNGPGRCKLENQEETSGSDKSMHGYILTSGFKGRRTHSNSGFSKEGTLTSASAVPHCISKREKTDPNRPQVG